MLEDKLGKEEGRKMAQAIEIGLEVIDKKSVEVSVQRKLELRDELTKELASKADLKAVEARLEGKIDVVKIELEGKIDRVKIELNTKLNCNYSGYQTGTGIANQFR